MTRSLQDNNSNTPYALVICQYSKAPFIERNGGSDSLENNSSVCMVLRPEAADSTNFEEVDKH